jgi:hypothetical protein
MHMLSLAYERRDGTRASAMALAASEILTDLSVSHATREAAP